jgi:hypothetical protein
MEPGMTPEDDCEIRNLIGRVAWLTDKWETHEQYLENCTDDFHWQVAGDEPYIGHEGMARRLQEMLDLGVCGPGVPSRHHVTSVEVISQDDPDRAKIQSFLVMVTAGGPAPVVAANCDYHDEARRVNGRWLLSKRYIVADWTAPAG